MILALQTTTFSAFGGIPTYNRLVCRVLNEIGDVGQSHVLVAMDQVAEVEEASEQLPNLRLQAFNQNRWALTRRLMHLVLTQKFDLALIGHINYAPLGCMLKRLRPRLRYGVMLYGIEAWQPLAGVRRRALRRADFMISISEYTKQMAIEANGLSADRVYLLPNAVEWTDIDPATELPRTAGTRLLTVCRLDHTEQYKGVDKVIEVLPKVLKRVPDVQYTVVGGGTDLERHRALAERLGIASRVQFLGFITDEALAACYRECDVFVMPSAGEGFGFVFLEAMKYGKPIVAARSGGAPEVVRDGVNGKLVEYGNKHELLEALIDLCLNRNKREMLGAGGHRRLQENYTFEHFKEKFVDIIRLESRPQSARRFSPSHKSN